MDSDEEIVLYTEFDNILFEMLAPFPNFPSPPFNYLNMSNRTIKMVVIVINKATFVVGKTLLPFH